MRTLPYLAAWRERYEPDGLALLGVHSPRFPFSRQPEAVRKALPGLGIEWPVALDPELRIWRDYGCRGWPSLFLWSRGGALRWYHLGEGEYLATEEAIRAALEEAGVDASGWPPPPEPLRPGDAAGAKVIAPTPELFPGGDIERPWVPAPGRSTLGVDYEAAGAYVAADGEGEIAIRLDGEELDPVEITRPGLYELVEHRSHQRHGLELEASPGIGVYSLQFAAGAPEPT
ncbi:MAG: hypothetical protein ACRDL6_08485 [Solirubrobacterales bacterium]